MKTKIRLKRPFKLQQRILDCVAKEICVMIGRRGSKTTTAALKAIDVFLKGGRVKYVAPTADQTDRFWAELTQQLMPAIRAGHFRMRESQPRQIWIPGTNNAIVCHTSYQPNNLRGDYCDLLIIDEAQSQNEAIWESVGMPMMADTDGTIMWICTPPNIFDRTPSYAKDPLKIKRLFERSQVDPYMAYFHGTSYDNPHLSHDRLERMKSAMPALHYRIEMLAEVIDEDPAALWSRKIIKHAEPPEQLYSVVVGVDPTGSQDGSEAGIVVAAKHAEGYTVLADYSLSGSTEKWATKAIDAYLLHQADGIVVERNFGGDLVKEVLRRHSIGMEIPIWEVHASRGKEARAAPIALLYEQDKVRHAASFASLEDQMCTYVRGSGRPNDRYDALVFALTELSRAYEVHYDEEELKEFMPK